jgi:hypothetical protein
MRIMTQEQTADPRMPTSIEGFRFRNPMTYHPLTAQAVKAAVVLGKDHLMTRHSFQAWDYALESGGVLGWPNFWPNILDAPRASRNNRLFLRRCPKRYGGFRLAGLA